MVCHADLAGRGDPDVPSPVSRWLEVADSLHVYRRTAPWILTGRHLIAAGLEPGPSFGPRGRSPG